MENFRGNLNCLIPTCLQLLKLNITYYHAWWIIPFGGCLVAYILKVIEEQEPDHPEQAGDDEDHNNQAAVQGAVHLNDQISY